MPHRHFLMKTAENSDWWMGIPDADYDNDATVEYDWIHALTMREFNISRWKLIQEAIRRIKKSEKK